MLAIYYCTTYYFSDHLDMLLIEGDLQERGSQLASGQSSREAQKIHSIPVVTRQWIAGHLDVKPQKQEEESEFCPFWLGNAIRTLVLAPLVVESRIARPAVDNHGKVGGKAELGPVGKSRQVQSRVPFTSFD